MGNEKANHYWEAELPPNYNRGGMEIFIRAKYEGKKWIPRGHKPKLSPSVSEEEESHYRPGPKSGGYKSMDYVNHVSEEKKTTDPPLVTNDSIPTPKTCPQVHVPQKVIPDTRPQEPLRNSEPPVSMAESVKQEVNTNPSVSMAESLKQEIGTTPSVSKAESIKKDANTTPSVAPAKVDYATELINLLCMGDTRESNSNVSQTRVQPQNGTGDLFKDSLTVKQSFSEKPQEDAKPDNVDLFAKSSMVSPFSIHQQQLTVVSQQQSIMATAGKPNGGSQAFPINGHQLSSNGFHFPSPTIRNIGHQVPGMVMPVAGLQKHMQMGNHQQMYPSGNSVTLPSSSLYSPGPVAPPTIGMKSIGGRPISASPVPSGFQPQWGKDYDFSSLTQGMFTKR
ncbi:putative ARF GTPase activator [Corchorus olitorius]|uniref:ARF GTPase activator n=1 Tax=Corchorus olitorius TaxID=93759 RepID=A0A1R3H4C4_9ROSI|nr:putative ARF GTPase activator [Corchorus olitorius]